MFPASFPPKVPSLWRPLPTTGSLRVGSPASQVIFGAPTPCHPSPRASLPSPSDTAPVPDSFALIVGQVSPIMSRGLVSGLPFPVVCRTEMTGPPRFLGDPLSACPALRPRWNSGTLAAKYPEYCLPLVERRRLPQLRFRGSITRPTDFLCTLRSSGCPNTTQHSVPAANTLGRVGLVTYGVPLREKRQSPEGNLDKNGKPRDCL